MSVDSNGDRPPRANPSAVEGLSGRGALPKSARVREKREFDRIHHHAIRVRHPDFDVLACRTLVPGDGTARFGCAVSRKVGPAVVRNRLKRLMREVFRQCRERLPKVDLVVILRPSAARLAQGGLPVMANELIPAFERACAEVERTPRSGARRRRRKKRSTVKAGANR